ncbi:MAG: NAD-dependent epimerase/dehydratase family protein [Planctomycetes bacterium]|nr:NAD-dependent epimerase/dehydratase family protein [Planctomycetota bacterium]
MPKALLTGATGFIGGALLRELLAREWNVRVLHRPRSDLRNLEGHSREIERCVGDLRDPDSLKAAMEGCDMLFHLAARYLFSLAGYRDMYLDNVEGTRNILRVAANSGVKKIVYTSTVGVLSVRSDGKPVDESEVASFDQLPGHYKRTKWLADQEAFKAAREGAPVVIVCPTAPVGPGDWKPTPTGKIIVDFLAGRMKAYVETGLNLVAVEDVAVGHILAAEKGEVGRRYILGKENLSLKEILDLLSEITGIPSPKFKLPRQVLLPFSLLSEGIALITGKLPGIPFEAAHMAHTFMYFDCTRAVHELEFRPRCVKEALQRAVEWFRKNRSVACTSCGRRSKPVLSTMTNSGSSLFDS